MAVFTTESAVREKFQLTDTTLVTTALVTGSMDDAHELVLRFLDPIFDVPSPDAEVVLGETLLSGAHLLRSLASSEAFNQKRLTVGGQRIDVARRFEALNEAADSAGEQAWEVLEPFVFARPAAKAVDVTETTPIIEED